MVTGTMCLLVLFSEFVNRRSKLEKRYRLEIDYHKTGSNSVKIGELLALLSSANVALNIEKPGLSRVERYT